MTPVIVRRAGGDSGLALRAAGVHPVLARVLAARGIAAPDDVAGSLESLPRPAELKGAEEAAVRLAHAIESRQKIVIVADYDADGDITVVIAALVGVVFLLGRVAGGNQLAFVKGQHGGAQQQGVGDVLPLVCHMLRVVTD